MAAAASKDGENFSILHSTKQSSTKKKDKSSSWHSFTNPVLVSYFSVIIIFANQRYITDLFIRMSCLEKSSHEHVPIGEINDEHLAIQVVCAYSIHVHEKIS